ncbi:MAG: hypothetical protein HKN47_22290 [Pirellulaceae bacterium]|nr:hypothetical protein [Pirellulaceae bacterium]
MGNPTSWLIFLIGVIAVTTVGIALLVAVFSAMVSFFKRRAVDDSVDPVAAVDSDPLRTKHPTAPGAGGDAIADTIIGFNNRKSDNRFQAIFIAVSVVLMAAVGVILAIVNVKWQLPWIAGALIGAFAGLVIGLLASGILIMIYRAATHLRG